MTGILRGKMSEKRTRLVYEPVQLVAVDADGWAGESSGPDFRSLGDFGSLNANGKDEL
jgi:hypothetical protein